MAALSVCVSVTNLWESPDSARDIDAPMLSDVPDPAAWPGTMNRDQKLGLNNLVGTQLLYGEPVELLEERGVWARVVAPWQPSGRDPRGYPGWVRRTHLAARTPSYDREAVVAIRSARLEDTDVELSYATILPVLDVTERHVVVALPGEGVGRLDPSACVVREPGHDREVDPDAVVAAARRFLGLDYLWGGMSSFGLDCSGLVHIAFRALGRAVPRDAHDQAEAARRLDREAARPGDLFFYAREDRPIHHVGFVVRGGPGQLLHAPRTGSQVVDEEMTEERRETLVDYVGRFTT